MNILLVQFLIILVIGFSNGFVCTKQFCKSECAPVNCNEETEIFVEKGSTCRCCDACYKKLYEGDRCKPMMPGGGAFLAKCVDGLKCGEYGKCVKELC
ncbi:hypothetical protein JTB14_021782 [Gonioctena quinquepunctata]|nr:hypothetical protein JTB14_021782 [Gonioctena quinquepunctata]